MDEAKQVTRFEILERTDKDIAVAFWYEDGTKEILIMTNDVVEELLKLPL